MIQIRIHAAFGNQLLMGSHFSDRTAGKHDDLIRMLQRGDAVRNDDVCFACAKCGKVAKDLLLGIRIHGGNGIVQNQDFRVENQRACNCNALLLPAGKGNTAFADHGFISIGKLNDVVVYASCFRRSHNLVKRPAVVAKGDVVADRIRKQEIILHHIARRAAKRFQ